MSGGGRSDRMDWEYQRNRNDITRAGAGGFHRNFDKNWRSNNSGGSGGQVQIQSYSSHNFRRHQQQHYNQLRNHHWTRPSGTQYKSRFDRKRKAASDIDMDEDWEEPVMSLINLPDEVGEHICLMLDAPSLLTLRRVSTTTKRWVESRQIISKLKVEISTSKQLQQISKSNIPWSNFAVKCMSLGSQTLMEEFEKKFSNNIKFLQIFTPKGWPRKEQLLATCSRIQILELSDFTMDLNNDNPVEMAQFRLICRNSVNMKRFKLDSIVTTQVELSIAAFFTWLSYMGNLEYLRIPKFVWNSNQMMSEEKTMESRTKNQDCFISKLTDYLKQRQRVNPHARNLRILDIEEFVDFEGQQFQKLAWICDNFSIQIINAASYLLKKALDLNATHVWSVVKSLSGYHPLLPYESMNNLTKISMSCFIPHDHLDLMMPNGFQIVLPRLKTLIINIYGQESIYMQRMLDVFLHRTPRPSVETLVVKCHEAESEDCISSVDLASNFRTVKKFELHNYKGNFEDYRILFSTMTSLEEITIKDCKQLTDQAFVIMSTNNYKPSSFIDLKNLRKLTIRTYERGITDVSLKVTFSRLPLRSFHFACIGRPTITAEGYRSLASSPLLETMQYLDVVKPQDLTDWEHREILRGFSNLIKRRH